MDTTTSFYRHFLYFMFVLDLCVTYVHPDVNAPCLGCRLFNPVLKQVEEDKSGPMCVYPCPQCSHDVLECQAGVSTIIDGCSCCMMCARQLGDLCSLKDKCDASKNLYCSVSLPHQTGTCLGENKKPCNVMGAIYKDGESFYMGCSKICTCQNGFHGCVDQCPQERVKPSELTCHEPKLMPVKGKCCREWTCQKLEADGHSLSSDKGLESGNLIGKNPMWYRTSTPLPNDTTPAPPTNTKYGQKCNAVKSAWSPCSVTCGVGVAVRLVVDKDTCVTKEKQQLCYLRPCGVKVATLGRDKCTPTTRTASKQRIQFQDCVSVKKYKPKFCTNCKEGACCYPRKYRTKTIEFQCTEGKMEIMDFMWIRKCRCRSKCYNAQQPEKQRNSRRWRERRRRKKMKDRERRRKLKRKRRIYTYANG